MLQKNLKRENQGFLSNKDVYLSSSNLYSKPIVGMTLIYFNRYEYAQLVYIKYYYERNVIYTINEI